jgi:hypothetical protein
MPSKPARHTTLQSVRANPLRIGLALALLLLALGIAIQTRQPDLVTRQEKAEILAGSLDRSHTLGQSFIAQKDNLTSIQFNIQLADRTPVSSANVTFHLKTGSDGNVDIAAKQIKLSELSARPDFIFSFPPQRYSQGKTYFVLIETNAEPGWISLMASLNDAYFDGSLYQNSQPANRDLAFRTYTALFPIGLFLDLAASGQRMVMMIIISLIFTLLGGSILNLLGIKLDNFMEWLILASACGVCIPPLIYTLSLPFHLHISSSLLWYLLFVLIGLAMVKTIWLHAVAGGRKSDNHTYSRSILDELRKSYDAMKQLPKRLLAGLAFHASDLLLILLFLFALVVRLLQVVDVPSPLWVDGLTHTRLVQNIINNQGLSSDVLYHTGFHTNIAFLNLLTGLPVTELMIVFGQWLIGLCGLTWFLLANKGLAMPKFAAISTAIAIWFFATLPGYLINWGRYPFIQGITLLPVAIVMSLKAYRQPRLSNYLAAVIFIAGLFLSHYGTLSFWLTFMLVFLAYQVYQSGVRSTLTRLRGIASSLSEKINLRAGLLIGVLAIVALLIILRYIPLIFGNQIQTIILQSRQATEDLDYGEIVRINLQSGGLWLCCAGVAGSVLAALRYRRIFIIIFGWFACQAVLIALQSPFLGEAVASYTNLLLIVSLPMSILAGITIQELLSVNKKHILKKQIIQVSGRGYFFYPIYTWFFLVGIVIAGSFTELALINPKTVLFSQADKGAMDWIMRNTPAQARFLINSNYWGSSKSQVVPSDGGGWIQLLTGRKAIYIQKESDQQDPEKFIRANGIEYIYDGIYPGFLDQQLMKIFGEKGTTQSSNDYEVVYHKDGIRILKRLIAQYP